MRPIRRFTSLAFFRGESPIRRISPFVGLRRPQRSLRSVVFPAPLGPKMVRNSPGRTTRSTPSTAGRAPKERRRLFASIAASAAMLPVGLTGRGGAAGVDLLEDLDRLARQGLARLL